KRYIPRRSAAAGGSAPGLHLKLQPSGRHTSRLVTSIKAAAGSMDQQLGGPAIAGNRHRGARCSDQGRYPKDDPSDDRPSFFRQQDEDASCEVVAVSLSLWSRWRTFVSRRQSRVSAAAASPPTSAWRRTRRPPRWSHLKQPRAQARTVLPVKCPRSTRGRKSPST